MPTVKKTWPIDPVLVRRARRICGARTETKTVTKALREILVRDEIDKAFRRHGPASATIEELFPAATPEEGTRELSEALREGWPLAIACRKALKLSGRAPRLHILLDSRPRCISRNPQIVIALQIHPEFAGG